MSKPFFIYIATALTGMIEPEASFLRRLIKLLSAEAIVLPWAFSLDFQGPRLVPCVYHYDRTMMLCADIVLALYLSDRGSDGRGAEIEFCVENGLNLTVYTPSHFLLSAYMGGMFTRRKVLTRTFALQPPNAISELSAAMILDINLQKGRDNERSRMRREEAIGQLGNPEKDIYCKLATQKMIDLSANLQ